MRQNHFYSYEHYSGIGEDPDITKVSGPGGLNLSSFLVEGFAIAEGTQTGSYDIMGLAFVNYTITLNKESP